MLRWIKSGKSDHPLDSKDAAHRLLEQLAGKDAVPALEQVSAYLDAVKTADNLKPAAALEIVDLLDRTGRPLQRRLNQDYVSEGARLTMFQKVRLWSAVYNYWAQLTEGYRFCLAKYEVGAVGAAALKAYLPRITCRAMRSCAGRIKWTLLHYGPIDPQVWQDLGSLYLLSESLQFSRSTLRVYRGAQGESTAEREFLRALMLPVSAPDGLFPIQIEIAERIVAQVAAGFQIAPRPAPGIHFIFELSGDRVPARLPASPQFSSRTRCFGPGAASAQMENMLKFIEQHELLPPDLPLGGNYDPGLVQATLAHLSATGRAPARAQGGRRRQLEHVTVVHEYERGRRQCRRAVLRIAVRQQRRGVGRRERKRRRVRRLRAVAERRLAARRQPGGHPARGRGRMGCRHRAPRIGDDKGNGTSASRCSRKAAPR